MSASSWKQAGDAVPSDSFAVTPRQRVILVGAAGLVVLSVSLALNLYSCGAAGFRLPRRISAPAGRLAAETVGEIMQPTFGSEEVSVKAASVRLNPVFLTRIWTSPVSPVSGNGSWSPSRST